MKVLYWVAAIKSDAPCYSVRAKTRKECARLADEEGAHLFDPPEKVTLEYGDAFDLVTLMSREGGPAEVY